MSETNTIPVDSAANVYPEAASREMIEAGVFYGRQKSKTNPKMRQYVLTQRAGIEIINLAQTAEAMEKAIAFLKEKVRNGGFALFVGTEPSAEAGIKELSKKYNMPYVTDRWAGGTITNFKVLSKRIEYFKKLRSDLSSGALINKYTKKERLDLEKDLERLLELFGGLELLTKEPDVLVVIDPKLHDTAVREAQRAKIPVIALANVDSNPDVIDYLVPGNDRAVKSINWFLGKIDGALKDGLALRAKAALEAARIEAEKASEKNAAKDGKEGIKHVKKADEN
ncbi:MAG: 30S ribosomal protein S2 [Patescibacteria group bacterium]|nr:30S ribosomal protein S2 [Patescibacteria group bacterium]MDE2015758.1 30S ribosomal protein S2 [Patescibacteria group bacterium]MDE2226815.1 30S ribosomal protein S2 [Patescibacteria group bacterium]